MQLRVEEAKTLSKPVERDFELFLAFGALEPTSDGYKASILHVISNGELLTHAGSIKERSVCIGSGSPYAKGILEAWLECYAKETEEPPYFTVNMPLSSAQVSAMAGLVNATSATKSVGKPYYMATITEDGWQWVTKGEIEKLEATAKDYLEKQKTVLHEFIHDLVED